MGPQESQEEVEKMLRLQIELDGRVNKICILDFEFDKMTEIKNSTLKIGAKAGRLEWDRMGVGVGENYAARTLGLGCSGCLRNIMDPGKLAKEQVRLKIMECARSRGQEGRRSRPGDGGTREWPVW